MNQLTVLERQKEYNVKEIEALKPEAIRQFLCPNASPEEAMIFVKFCKAEALNPFLKEVHLIKYAKDMSASIVVGIDTFVKRACRNPNYDGMRSGLIVVNNDSGEIRETQGASYLKGQEDIIASWAEVHHKHRQVPIRREAMFEEYVRETKIWKEKPATMIVKVAEAQGLKKSFPEDIPANLYEYAEVDVTDTVSPNTPIEVTETIEVEKGEKELAYQEWAERIPTEGKLLDAWNMAMSKRFYIFANKELGIEDKGEVKAKVADLLGVEEIQSMKEVVKDAGMLRDLNIAVFEETGKVIFK
jgi:phage recombination protein Bet